MSDSVRPYRRKPTRLPRPWDSPGENTRVGCHFLLQCIKVKSESEVAQSYPTLSDPMDCSLPGFSIHRIFQARVLEWGAIAFSNLLGTRNQIYHLTQCLAHIRRLISPLTLCSEKAMAPHSSTLAWKIPWTEEPGRLQSMGLQRVGHD